MGPLRPNPDGSLDLPLTNSIATALIDAEDYPRVARFKWRIDSGGYVVSSVWDVKAKKCVRLSLHRMICRAPADLYVDHRWGHLLDCRKVALRPATNSQNQANRLKLLPNKLSRWRGVTIHRTGKFQAQIKVMNRNIHLGLFRDEDAAGLAYNKASRRYFGRFGYQNPIRKREASVAPARVA